MKVLSFEDLHGLPDPKADYRKYCEALQERCNELIAEQADHLAKTYQLGAYVPTDRIPDAPLNKRMADAQEALRPYVDHMVKIMTDAWNRCPSPSAILIEADDFTHPHQKDRMDE